ncbi:hypothetical protein NDU88_007085 [Pleurodeles waltl]|uniref:Uncharacterized protein n=1 Tax=Pleurodeles waltl TaxID=8319 RepID=A0AAV7N143_PLEWA|nr:hypothetical protein NDU88_007085 [Pleurodeles waltl]
MGKPKAPRAPGPELDLASKEGEVLETLAQLDTTLKSHYTLEDTTWVTPHSKRRKRKSRKAGPSRAQAVTEQEKAIQEAAHFSHNFFLVLFDKFQFPSDSDTGATSPSKTSGDERATLITPRLADDL